MLSKSLLETQLLARGFIDGLRPGHRATVVGLYGDLGSGKTSFTQGAADALGIEGAVQSPTFVIEKIYDAAHPHFKKFVHIDAYRLESPDELAKLGWEDISSRPGYLIFIEWAEKVEDILPDDRLAIRFEYVDEETRKITI